MAAIFQMFNYLPTSFDNVRPVQSKWRPTFTELHYDLQSLNDYQLPRFNGAADTPTTPSQ